MALGDIILLKNKTPLGPFTRAQVQEGMSRGEFSAHDLAHTPGLKDWLPLEEVLHHLDHDVVKAPRTAIARDLPPVPGTRISAAEPPSVAPSLSPPVLPAVPPLATTPEITPPAIPPPPPQGQIVPPAQVPLAIPIAEVSGLKPAPMRPRFLAWAIDCAVLFLPIFVLYGFSTVVLTAQGALEHMDSETMHQERSLLNRNLEDLLLLVAIGFGWIYGAGLESSRWQATVGKQWMGLVVTDASGARLHFLQATRRHFAKYLSALPCFAGFMAALFNPRRLAWHDRLAATRVLTR